jgi:PAS domain S-box-containing protein
MLIYENVDELAMVNDAVEAGGMAWWVMEYPSGTVFFHPNKVEMLGYDKKDADDFVHYTHFTNLVHPDDHAGAMQAMMDHIQGKKESYETVYRIKGKDGEYRKFFDRGKIIARTKDGNLAVGGIVIDISDEYLKKS